MQHQHRFLKMNRIKKILTVNQIGYTPDNSLHSCVRFRCQGHMLVGIFVRTGFGSNTKTSILRLAIDMGATFESTTWGGLATNSARKKRSTL